MKKLPELKTWLRWQLRKISLRWPARSQAMARARVEWGVYKCEGCKSTTRAKDVQADHIVPVVGSEGFTNWDDFITRLFCSADNYQILCKTCHQIKTTINHDMHSLIDGYSVINVTTNEDEITVTLKKVS